MLDDVLHNQCVQVMDVDQVMAEEVDQVMAVVEDQVMAVDAVEMDQQETNTKEEAVHVHPTEDKVEIQRKSGSLQHLKTRIS